MHKRLPPRILMMAAATVLLCLPWPAALPTSASTTEDEIKQLVVAEGSKDYKQMQVDTCKVDGDWAACDFTFNPAGGIAVLHRTGGQWHVKGLLTGRGGPVMQSEWQYYPPEVAANFGFGKVPRAVAEALRTEARRYHGRAGNYGITTSGRKFFGATMDEQGATRAAWEYINGKWSVIFTYKEPLQNATQIFASHGFSPYMANRVRWPNAVSGGF